MAWVGDTRQLGAVDAGKPFELLQRRGTATATLPDNLRAASPLMKAVVAALDTGDIAEAFAALKPVTVEVPPADAARAAAELWLKLPAAERDATLLLSSGRALRSEANLHVQAGLKAQGLLTGQPLTLEVLDRVTVTREAARHVGVYAAGRVVEFGTDLPTQGFARGDRGTVTGSEGDRVTLRLASGREATFRPDKLPRNLKDDAVAVNAVKRVDVYAGDRIRWTGSDKGRGLLNADIARVTAAGAQGLTVASRDGTTATLARGDKMLEHLDLAYAINAHTAQGVTAEHGIVVMRSSERQLASAKTFLVALTRIVDRATLVVDRAAAVERAVTRNSGGKSSALETISRIVALVQAMPQPAGRDTGPSTADVTQRKDPERYLDRSLAREPAREADREISRAVSREPDLQADFGL